MASRHHAHWKDVTPRHHPRVAPVEIIDAPAPASLLDRIALTIGTITVLSMIIRIIFKF